MKAVRMAAVAASFVGVAGAAFVAGAASASNPDTMSKLNLAVDTMTKAQALLNASNPTTRSGIYHLGVAKTRLSEALAETAATVKAEGG